MISDLNIIVWKWSKIAIFFGGGGLFCLTKQGGNHASQWIRDLWSKDVSLILAYFYTFLGFCVLDDFFCFSKKKLVLGYSWFTLLWYRCYYPHRSMDALSPVCGIYSSFFYLEFPHLCCSWIHLYLDLTV